MRDEELYGVTGARNRWIRLEMWMVLVFMGVYHILPGLYYFSTLETPNPPDPHYVDSTWALGLMFPFAWILFVSGDHPSMFGFTWPKAKEIAIWALILVVVIALERAYFLTRLDWFGFEVDQGRGTLVTVLSVFALTLVPAASEEFLCRGILQTRMVEVYGNGLAVAGTAIVFGLAHIYQGTNGVFFATLTGLILGFGRSRGASLLTLTIVHAAWNTALYLMWNSVVPNVPTV